MLSDLSSLGHSLINVSQGYGGGVDDIAPSRSPDGKWVAFTSNRDGNWDIYAAKITQNEVTPPQRVTHDDGADVAPVWSPNSQYLAYRSNRDGNWEIYLVNVVTGIEKRLTFNPANDTYPSWSPDGSKLVFQSDRSGIWQIYVADVKTNSKTLVSDGTHQDTYPTFSPDGTRILFRANAIGGDAQTIYVMNADGSDPEPISNPTGAATNAVWSSDGQLIAYQSNLDGDLDIYIYDTASRQTRKLTDNTANDYAPNWRCGQSTLIFNSDVNGDPNLFQVAALPIDAAPVAVEADIADQLTFNEAEDLYGTSAGNNEGDWDFDQKSVP